jgi:hypothetical protein
MSTVTATLVMRGPRLTLRSGPVLSGFMRVSCTIDFPLGRQEQAPMTRVVHLRAQDLEWLVDALRQHVWTIQSEAEVEDGPEFLNLDTQIKLSLLEGALDVKHTPIFSVRCLLAYAEPNDGGGSRSWMGVEAEVEGPAALRFVEELRELVRAIV